MKPFSIHEDLTRYIIALHQKLDGQQELLARLVEVQMKSDKANQSYFPSKSRREDQLLQAIHKAVGVLEESKKSFRSKQLECLRKHLQQVLIDEEDHQ